MTELSNKIEELRNAGKTYSEISKELSCSKGTISYHVGVGQKEKHRERVRGGRKKILNFLHEYKQNLGCMDCGEDYPYWMLDFDHVHGEKLFLLSGSWSGGMNMDAILKEIEKCEVVCSNCHRNRTHMRFTGRYTKDVSEFYGVAASAAE